MEIINMAKRTYYDEIGVAIEYIWLLTIFIVPLVFNPFSLNSFYFIKALVLVFLVCTMLGLVVARWLLAGNAGSLWTALSDIMKAPLKVSIIIFGLIWILSTIFSIMPNKSIWGNLGGTVGLLPNLAWILFFLIIADVMQSRTQIFRALYALIVSSGLVSLLGVIQYFNHGILPWFGFYGRVFSTDGNPLFMSAFLSMSMPLTLAMIILNWYGAAGIKKNKIYFAGLLVVFGLQLCCLAMAQYSITLLLFIIGIFSFFILISLMLKRRAVIVMSALLLVAIAVIAGALLAPMLMSQGTGQASGGQGGLSTAEQAGLPTISIRIHCWKAATSIMMESPEIGCSQDKYHWMRRAIGYGPETLAAVSQARFPDTLKSDYTFRSTVIAQPENHYFFLGVTIGILGLLAFLCILTLFFRMAVILLTHSRERDNIVLFSAFIAAILQYCGYILLNASVITPELVFWLVLGLTAVMSRKQMIDDNRQGLDIQVLRDSSGSSSQSPGWLRKSLAVLAVIAFVGFGLYLTVPPLIANMKIQAGLNIWDKDKSAALALEREATVIEPHQGYYFNFAGSVAFTNAKTESDPAQKVLLLGESESYYLTAIREEPQMAVWYYRLGDLDTYWAMSGDKYKLADALLSYEKADCIFPGNAVILNKWATALMLAGDYAGAAAKLTDAEHSDSMWIQTKYFRGLLEALEGDSNAATQLFLSPARSAYEGIRYFIDFSTLLHGYGKTGIVREALQTNQKSLEGDWVAYAFLGIADISDSHVEDAATAFRQSAALVPAKDKFLLAGAIQAMAVRYTEFKEAGGEIIKDLMKISETDKE